MAQPLLVSSEPWPDLPGVAHGFFTREGGVRPAFMPVEPRAGVR